MSEAEDVCGCLACAMLCGVCCVAAAEEDKRERERAALETQQLKNPAVVQVNPVAVPLPYSQQKESQMNGAMTQSEPKEPTPELTKKKTKKSKKNKDGGSTSKRKAGRKHQREPPSH